MCVFADGVGAVVVTQLLLANAETGVSTLRASANISDVVFLDMFVHLEKCQIFSFFSKEENKERDRK